MQNTRRPGFKHSIALLMGSTTMAMAHGQQAITEFWGVGGGYLLLLIFLLLLPEKLLLKTCLLVASPVVAFLLIDHLPGHPTLNATSSHLFWFGLGSAIVPALIVIAIVRIGRRLRKKTAV